VRSTHEADLEPHPNASPREGLLHHPEKRLASLRRQQQISASREAHSFNCGANQLLGKSRIHVPSAKGNYKEEVNAKI